MSTWPAVLGSLRPTRFRTTMPRLLVALLGSALLAASARVSLPLWPVPATMQTLVVLLLGGLGGSWLGVEAVVLYLAEGAVGLPVFAGATGLAGPTAGYLLGFLPAAWIAGFAQARQDRTGWGWVRCGAILLAAHMAVFVPGVAWLSAFVGLQRALAAGFVWFLPGTLVKTILAAIVLRMAGRSSELPLA